MTLPTDIKLEKCWEQALAAAELRQALHTELDRWLDRVEKAMEEKGPQPPLWEITETIRNQRQDFMSTVAKAWVERKYQDYLQQEKASCPRCGRYLNRWGIFARPVETLIGTFTLERPYFYCRSCKHGFYPLDQALGLASQNKQYDIQKAGVKVVAEVTYEEASDLFLELTKVPLSDHVIHETAGKVAEGLSVLNISPSIEEIRKQIEEVSRGKKWKPILVLAIDGAHVPIRPEEAKGKRPGRKRRRAKRSRWKGEWREAKGFRFYLVNGDRIIHLLSWHQIQTDKELGEALKEVKDAGLIEEERVRLCAIGDGSRWIWKLVQELFPMAQQVLDYYHCSKHVYEVAATQFKGSPQKALEWVEATMARLFFGEVEDFLSSLKRMEAQSEEAQKAIESCAKYLEMNRHRVQYKSYRKGGYPIGSGAIESAHRFICHARLKRSGAWWYVGKGNGMLALRCAKYNGTFDRVFKQYICREQERNFDHSAKST